MLTCVYTIGVSTLLYVFLAQTGHIDEDWGRFDYFGGNQPNLGTEIISISVIYASCVMPPVRLIAFSVPSIYAINLMQGRAGLIVSILAIAISLYTRIKSTVNRSMVGVVAIGVLIASLTIYNEETLAYFNSILLLDDEHRGVDTGYVGRGDLWEGAWRAFLQSPIVGNGAGFEERLGVNPHNYFLYGLALFGMLSIFIFGVIFYLFYELYRTNIRWFLIVIVISIMLVFNDRFFNLNPYPFLLYVILFAHSQDIVSPTITGPKHWAKILELYRQQPATRLPYSLMSRANR
jgi:O-antigen ligase